jgi:hypothetical protein
MDGAKPSMGVPLRDWIKAQPFTFASTMPENPHHYIIEKTRGGPEFTAFVEYLETHGEVGIFEGYHYRYLEIDEFTYWLTHGVGAGSIINRKLTVDAGWDPPREATAAGP